MHDWVIELPWLIGSIDLHALKRNYPYDKAKNDPWRGVRCLEIEQDNPEMREFFKLYHKNEHYSKSPTYWLTHKSADTWISPHVDLTRDAVLLFPIIPETHTIKFLESSESDENVIDEWTYRCPSIPHAKIPHCVHDNGIERWFLQISLHIKNYSWEHVRELVDNGELF